MGWVSLWVVPLKVSFVFDRLGFVRLKGCCLNGVWQGVVGLCAICVYGGGFAALPAPFDCRIIYSSSWRLHAAMRHINSRLRIARQP